MTMSVNMMVAVIRATKITSANRRKLLDTDI